MSFGNKLKILRVSHRLAQEAISKKLNISQPVYSRYENDEKEVSEQNPIVKKVAEEFHVTAKWLLESGSEHSFAANELMLHDDGEAAGYYHVPKNFMAVLLKQQQMTEKILKLLTEK